MTTLERFEPQRISLNKRRHYITEGFPNVPDGMVLPSVTTLLSALAPIGKIMAIKGWRQKIGETEAIRRTRLAADRGTWLHGVLEDWFNNNDIEGHLDAKPNWRPYYDLMEPFLDGDKDKLALICDPDSLRYIDYCDGIKQPLLTESAVAWYDCDLGIGVAGTVDQLAFTKAGKLSLPDWKSSFKPKPTNQLSDYRKQLGGYSLAIEQMYKCSIDEAWSVLACYDPENPESEPMLQLVHLEGFELVCEQEVFRSLVKRYFDAFYPGKRAFSLTQDRG